MNVMVYILAVVISMMTVLSLIVIVDQLISIFFRNQKASKVIFIIPKIGIILLDFYNIELEIYKCYFLIKRRNLDK